MQIDVAFLDNLKLDAKFDDYAVLTDQPVRYKGDGLAPSPFDFFLASSALCAAYFAKVYCKARGIPTEDIRVSQNYILDPENRYKQTFHIRIELPASLSEKDRTGILRSMERCTVKKVIQEGPTFKIEAVDTLGADDSIGEMFLADNHSQTMILGKDRSLEDTIASMTGILKQLDINIEIASWRNIVPGVWSVHVRDADSPVCYTNGKGATKESALCSALGEYIERLSCNYFYNDYYLGDEIADAPFVHYPNEKWFLPDDDDAIPAGLMDPTMLTIYNPTGELRASHLIDTNSGRADRGICALPFVRESDRSLNGCCIAGNHDLSRRVEVDGVCYTVASGLCADLDDDIVVEPQDRGHRARADRDGALHQLRTALHNRQCVGKADAGEVSLDDF